MPSVLICFSSNAATHRIDRLYISRSGLLLVPERRCCCTLASPVCWCHRRVSVVTHKMRFCHAFVHRSSNAHRSHDSFLSPDHVLARMFCPRLWPRSLLLGFRLGHDQQFVLGSCDAVLHAHQHIAQRTLTLLASHKSATANRPKPCSRERARFVLNMMLLLP